MRNLKFTNDKVSEGQLPSVSCNNLHDTEHGSALSIDTLSLSAPTLGARVLVSPSLAQLIQSLTDDVRMKKKARNTPTQKCDLE